MFRLTCMVILGLFLAWPVYAFAIEDTPQNRELEANRYLQAVPPDAGISDISKRMAESLPQQQRDSFISGMNKNIDMTRITMAMREALIKTFTADQLHALADFYASPGGKAAMEKMGAYTELVMPTVMKEVEAALAKTQKEAKAK
ncbi:MAG: DUF2059 domain-containing protein [Rhodomicrobium sp.]